MMCTHCRKPSDFPGNDTGLCHACEAAQDVKPTAKAAILARLRESGEPLACHELHIPCVSENAAATRLSELARAGLVVGRTRHGKAYKEWQLA